MAPQCRATAQSPTNGGAWVFNSTSFSPASFAALSWLLDQIIVAVQQAQAAGGGIKTRRRIQSAPLWLPDIATSDDDDALLMIGIL
ncbi:MAG: hypothetical protein RIR09_2973 [Pseudomonadota bacterium]